MRFLPLLFTLLLINSAAAKTTEFEHIEINTNIELIKINEYFYVHVSWYDSLVAVDFHPTVLSSLKTERHC